MCLAFHTYKHLILLYNVKRWRGHIPQSGTILKCLEIIYMDLSLTIQFSKSILNSKESLQETSY